MAQGFDAPPTLERSGSERRGGAVSSLSPEGERVGVRGGALFNGKEGRGDFRKDTPISLRVIEVITLIMDRRSLDNYYLIPCIFFHTANQVLNNGSLNASVG